MLCNLCAIGTSLTIVVFKEHIKFNFYLCEALRSSKSMLETKKKLGQQST